jgi:hypothetical protein
MPLVPVVCPTSHQEEMSDNQENDILIGNESECVDSVHASVEIGLPRLMQKDALVLCGIDIPEKVNNGTLRVIVALKRVWYDAPKDIALIIRNTIPSGEKRAAVIYRCLGDDAEPVGIEVPMEECGSHKIAVQIAKKVDGELIEVISVKIFLLPNT